MKQLYIPFSLFLCLLFIFGYSCRKEEIKKVYETRYPIILDDTLKVGSDLYPYGSSSYNFDIDNDKKDDISFSKDYISGMSGSYSNIDIYSKNGFEIYCDTVVKKIVYLNHNYKQDSSFLVSSPKKFNIGDSVKIDELTFLGGEFVSYSSPAITTPEEFDYYYIKDAWKGISHGYISFCNKTKMIMGTFRITFLNSSVLIIEELNVVNNTKSLIIK